MASLTDKLRASETPNRPDLNTGVELFALRKE